MKTDPSTKRDYWDVNLLCASYFELVQGNLLVKTSKSVLHNRRSLYTYYIIYDIQIYVFLFEMVRKNNVLLCFKTLI